VFFICVNYHNEEDTESFVKDCLKQEFAGLVRVVVVDNNEGEELEPRLLHLSRSNANVTVLNPGRNLGYFGAAAWGLRQCLRNVTLPTWLIVSNTDISVPRSDFLSELFALYEDHAPAVLAPSVKSTLSGVDQNPQILRRPSSMRWRLYTWVFHYYPTFILYSMLSQLKNKLRGFIWQVSNRKSRRKRLEKSEPYEIYAPHGSLVLFHRSYFEQGGSLENGTFMFGETIMVAETVRQLGLRIVYDPRLSVLHHEHATTGRFKSRRIAHYQWEASVYCFNEFFKGSSDGNVARRNLK
jgi:GT2 family glycosyltransferase